MSYSAPDFADDAAALVARLAPDIPVVAEIELIPLRDRIEALLLHRTQALAACRAALDLLEDGDAESFDADRIEAQLTAVLQGPKPAGPQYMIVTGNPVDGFSYRGPFVSHEDAHEWCDLRLGGEDWWITELQPAVVSP